MDSTASTPETGQQSTDPSGFWDRVNFFPPSSRGKLLLSAVIGLLMWGTYVSYYVVKFGLNHPPSATGDEPYYDSLGWELAQGNGFQLDTAEAEFRRPYDEAAKSSELYVLGPPLQGTITSRPPLFPLALAAGDTLFGRQFWCSRLLNSFCMAFIGAAVFWVALTSWGLVPALLSAVLFVLVDTNTRLYGRALLTEPLCAFFVTLMCLALWRLSRSPHWLWTQLAAVSFGMAVLARSMLILWLPGLLLMVMWLSWQPAPPFRRNTLGPAAKRRPRGLFSLGNGVAFLAVVVVVLIPWGVRNCVLLGRMMPLGAQGTGQLSAGYSDIAWGVRGIWQNLEVAGFYDDVFQPGMSLRERELALADASRTRAVEWIRQHPWKSMALIPLKIYQETVPRNARQAMLLGLVILGAWGTRTWQLTQLLLALIAVCLFSVGLTWSVADGRFLMPLLFAQHLLATAGLWWLISKALRLGPITPAEPVTLQTVPRADAAL